jgi:hypothetical protein
MCNLTLNMFLNCEQYNTASGPAEVVVGATVRRGDTVTFNPRLISFYRSLVRGAHLDPCLDLDIA